MKPISVFLDKTKVAHFRCQQNTRGVSRHSCHLDLLLLRYNCVKFYHCRYMRQILGREGLFASPSVKSLKNAHHGVNACFEFLM